jgi:GntR family transcriptional regulator, transcriptional repressor for pyruvate dehydrogenase complex
MRQPARTNTVMTASDRLAASIRDRIITGELASGDRLPPESEVSTNYRVGRSTVREAVRMLAGQGLVRIKRGVGGGAFVTPPDTTQLVDSLQAGIRLLTSTQAMSTESLAQIRELLEVPALELAALRRTDEELAMLRLASANSATADNPCASHGVHTTILRAAHNPLLEIFTESILKVIDNGYFPARLDMSTRDTLCRDHREIMGYVELRDQAGAREAGRAHLRVLSALYLDAAAS